MSGHKRISKHVDPEIVDNLFKQLRTAGISNTGLSNELGVSRTTLHLMFKHEIGMRKVYRIAIEAVIREKLHCKMCGKRLDTSDPLSESCGGDCLECMATIANDPDCMRRHSVITGRPFLND